MRGAVSFVADMGMGVDSFGREFSSRQVPDGVVIAKVALIELGKHFIIALVVVVLHLLVNLCFLGLGFG